MSQVSGRAGSRSATCANAKAKTSLRWPTWIGGYEFLDQFYIKK
jgi:hypothetical protein